MPLWQVRERFVCADVERAEDQRPALQSLRDARVGGDLLVLARHRVPLEEQELRAEEADAFGAVLDCGGYVVGRADVRDDLDPVPVARHRRPGGGGPGASGCLFALRRTPLVLGGELGVRIDVDGPGVPVEEQLGALGDAQQPLAESDGSRDSE